MLAAGRSRHQSEKPGPSLAPVLLQAVALVVFDVAVDRIDCIVQGVLHVGTVADLQESEQNQGRL